VRFYNKRGTAEQWIKEGKQAVAMTRLSCHRFHANEVRLRLSLIAYNLGNLWRRLALLGKGHLRLRGRETPTRPVTAEMERAVDQNRAKTLQREAVRSIPRAGIGGSKRKSR